MTVKARDYGAAKIVLWILGSIAWLQIIGGLLGLFAGGIGGSSQLEMTITVAMKTISAITILSGLLSLALVQMASANIHTAEINWEMLQIMRSSPTSANGSLVGNTSHSASTARSETRVLEFEGHKLTEDASFEVTSARSGKRQAWRLGDGRVVTKTAGGFLKAFDNLDELEKYIS